MGLFRTAAFLASRPADGRLTGTHESPWPCSRVGTMLHLMMEARLGECTSGPGLAMRAVTRPFPGSWGFGWSPRACFIGTPGLAIRLKDRCSSLI
jgi:hypothetical protein